MEERCPPAPLSLPTNPSYQSTLIINRGAMPPSAALLHYTVHSTLFLLLSTEYTVQYTAQCAAQYSVRNTIHSSHYESVHSTSQFTVRGGTQYEAVVHSTRQ